MGIGVVSAASEAAAQGENEGAAKPTPNARALFISAPGAIN